MKYECGSCAHGQRSFQHFPCNSCVGGDRYEDPGSLSAMKVAVFVFFFLLVFATATSVVAATWEAEPISVYDGDTITVREVGTTTFHRLRLYGIDAPEMGTRRWPEQPYAREARDYLARLLGQAEVCEVTTLALDKYGRTLSFVRVNGVRVQERMLKEGLAWVYGKYCEGCTTWEALQRKAREKKKGLWKEKAIEPWEWRY